jgi:hypothetical protein
MIAAAVVSARARALGAALEPVTGQVYFSPECHRAYEALGFAPSPMEMAGVAMPDGAAYFCSRGSVLGQVSGEVIAATFAVFNPEVVVPFVAQGWDLVSAEAICAARTAGAVGQLERILGAAPDGAGARASRPRAVTRRSGLTSSRACPAPADTDRGLTARQWWQCQRE